MSVAVEERATDRLARVATGGAPARRAVVRWSWRLFRREWRQQLLVLTLLTVAVAATTMGLAVAVNGTPPPHTTVQLPGTDPQIDADVAAIQQQYGPLSVIGHGRVPIPGSVATLDLRSEARPGDDPTLRRLAGRFPTAANEVAMTRHVAGVLGLRIGDTWHQDGHAFRVVGLVENPRDLDDQFALVTPAAGEPADTVAVLLHHDPSHLRPLSVPSGTSLGIEAESPSAKSAAAAAVLVLATIGLVFVGLVAVAGFTVMAQRRLRALGMLGSLGATDRHVRLVMLANGAAVGAGAALVGAAIGLGGWLAFAPRLETIARHRIDRFALPWWAIGAALVLALVTAVAAAWWPARAVARVSVVAALSGRPPRPQPAHRFATLGGVLVAAGVVLIGVGHQKHVLPILAGTVATTLGLLFLAPLAIRGIAAVGGRARIGVRLALRDLARYQARSGASLGAITLAVGIAATIAVSATVHESTTRTTTGPNLAANQLVVYLSGDPGSGAVPDQTAAQLHTAQSRVDAISTALHTHDVVALDAAQSPTAPDLGPPGQGPGGKPAAGLARTNRRSAKEFLVKRLGPVYVATPEVLARYGIDPSTIAPGTDLLSSRTDLEGAQLDWGLRQMIKPTIQEAPLAHGLSAPNTLITTDALRRLGLQEVPAAWILQTTKPLTTAQIDTATRLAAASGLSVETRSTDRSSNQLGTDATAAGILVALGVLAMTIGLIRSETAHDLRTLTATGASPRTRRTLTAATAGALALLGGVLGTAGAYLALAAWHRSELHTLTHVPVLDLVALVVGLPLVATIGGWLLAGREPPAIARRPLE